MPGAVSKKRKRDTVGEEGQEGLVAKASAATGCGFGDSNPPGALHSTASSRLIAPSSSFEARDVVETTSMVTVMLAGKDADTKAASFRSQHQLENYLTRKAADGLVLQSEALSNEGRLVFDVGDLVEGAVYQAFYAEELPLVKELNNWRSHHDKAGEDESAAAVSTFLRERFPNLEIGERVFIYNKRAGSKLDGKPALEFESVFFCDDIMVIHEHKHNVGKGDPQSLSARAIRLKSMATSRKVHGFKRIAASEMRLFLSGYYFEEDVRMITSELNILPVVKNGNAYGVVTEAF